MNTTTRIPRIRRSPLWAAGALGLTLTIAACGSSDPDEAEIRELLQTQIVEQAGISEGDAQCIVDGAFDAHDLDDLATFATDSPDPDVVESMTAITTDCLLNGDSLDDILEDSSPTAGTDATEVNLSDDAGDVSVEDTSDLSDQDDEEPELQIDPLTITTPEFCGASLAVHRAQEAATLLPSDSHPIVLQAAIENMLDHTQAAIAVAPNEQLAEAPIVYFDTVSELNALAAIHGYDISSIDYDDVEPLQTIVEQIEEALVRYLTGPCGVSEAELTDTTEELAAQLLSLAPDEAPEVFEIDDPTSGIQVDVPGHWTEFDRSADGMVRTLLVAPSIGEYDSSWLADGVMITAVDTEAFNEFVGPARLTAAWGECVLDGVEDYFDGAYTGEMYRFVDCGDTDTRAVVISARNESNTTQIVVELQQMEWSEEILDLIVMSFIV